MQSLENYFIDLFAQTCFGNRKIEADINIIDFFIERNNIDPDVKLSFGETIFSCLCELNDSETIIKFIDKYHPNVTNNVNDILSNVIKCNTSLDFIKMFISYGVLIDGENKGGTLISTSIYHHKEIVELLLNNGAEQKRNEALVSVSSSPESKDIIMFFASRFGCSVLMRAVGRVDAEIVTLLLDQGADIDAQDNE